MNSVFGSLVWKFLERGSVQIVQFIVSIVVARLLQPEAFGLVALLMVFITIATVFVQSGLGTALVQSKEINSQDLSSVFYYSIVIAIATYLILYTAAPYIESFYAIPDLSITMRVLALVLLPGAFNSIQNAIVVRKMQFKLLFVSNIIASLCSGAIGIYLAYHDYRQWAIVYQQLSYQLLICTILCMTVRWWPKLEFSFERTKRLLGYGLNLLGATLIDTIYHNLENIIIGKKYSPATLAFFNKGKMFPLVLMNNVDGSLQSVMLPAMSAMQNSIVSVKGLLRKSISMSTFLTFPLMAGLALCARPLVYLTLGDNWMDCIPFLQLYCFITVLFPIQTASVQAINSIGRANLYFRIMTAKRILGVFLLAGSVVCFKSVFAIVHACVIIEIVAVFIQCYYNKHLFGYLYREQVSDIAKNAGGAVLMAVVVYALTFFACSPFSQLFLQVIVGGVTYLATMYLMKSQNLAYCIERTRKLFSSNEVAPTL